MSSSSVAARARLTVFMETTLYRKGHARRESVGMHLAPTKEQDANLGADPRISNDQRQSGFWPAPVPHRKSLGDQGGVEDRTAVSQANAERGISWSA